MKKTKLITKSKINPITEVIKMKTLTTKIIIIGILILGMGAYLATVSNAGNISAQSRELRYVPGEVLITLSEGASLPQLDSNKSFSFISSTHIFGDVYKVKFTDNVNMADLKEWLLGLNGIKMVEFNYIIESQTGAMGAVPKGEIRSGAVPKEEIRWELEKIEATDSGAWSYFPGTVGSDSITIAVIDTGADLDHEDLVDNITAGHDYVNDDNDPEDDSSDYHGTHIAGIIGAIGDNDIGIKGVMWTVDLLIIKALDSQGLGTMERVVLAIKDAADSGADIINMSWAVMQSQAMNPDEGSLKDAVDYAYDKGCLLIAAAGNSAVESPFYPAAYDNVVGVTATTDLDKASSFTNIGDNYDIAAPGERIFSAAGDDRYGYLSGTSMSAAFVSGVAGLMLALDSDLTPSDIFSILTDTADSIDTEKAPHIRVNARKAVKNVYDNIGGGGGGGAGPTAVASVGEVGQDSIEVGVGVEVEFYSDGSSASEGSLQYMWDFGDGSNNDSSSEANPTHIYGAEGIYEVKLNVIDDDGNISPPDSVTVTVGAGGGGENRAKVTGNVTDKDTGNPIEDATVDAKLDTDTGQYFINVKKINYHENEKQVDLNPGDEVTEDFELQPYDSSDAGGRGASGLVTIETTKTDANGDYTLEFEVETIENTATVLGMVTDKDDGNGIESAHIWVKRKLGEDDKYIVEASKSGYHDEEVEKALVAGDEVAVDFELEAWSGYSATGVVGYAVVAEGETDADGNYSITFDVGVDHNPNPIPEPINPPTPPDPENPPTPPDPENPPTPPDPENPSTSSTFSIWDEYTKYAHLMDSDDDGINDLEDTDSPLYQSEEDAMKYLTGDNDKDGVSNYQDFNPNGGGNVSTNEPVGGPIGLTDGLGGPPVTENPAHQDSTNDGGLGLLQNNVPLENASGTGNNELSTSAYTSGQLDIETDEYSIYIDGEMTENADGSATITDPNSGTSATVNPDGSVDLEIEEEEEVDERPGGGGGGTDGVLDIDTDDGSLYIDGEMTENADGSATITDPNSGTSATVDSEGNVTDLEIEEEEEVDEIADEFFTF